MNASRLSAIVLALLCGALAASRSACLENGPLAAVEKARGMSAAVPGLLAPADTAKPGPTDKRFKGTGYALLVGCTKYDHLDPKYQLEGPANDVLLVRDLLLSRGFLADNVTILSEAGGKKRRPIKAHIKAEFERLAGVAKKGDLVFILLGGHGSRQPTTRPPELAKPDGLDEIFLPADVGKWEDSGKTVANAITDTEISGWLKAIRKQGASVVFIADACHSSTLARDPKERFRQVKPDDLVPREVLRKAEEEAAKRGGKSRGGSEATVPFSVAAEAPDLVALYAAQTIEPTVERPLPIGGRNPKPHGLFTYTLVEVVKSAAAPMTYEDVCSAIRHRYDVEMKRKFPTPAVEGKDRHLEFLGTEAVKGTLRRNRPIFRLMKDEEGWWVNAGAIHGLTKGSVLAVYPPAGKLNADKPLGHVQVTELDVLRAAVTPCAFNKMPAPAKLPPRGRCQAVYIDLGSQRLRVAAAPAAGTPKQGKSFRALEAALAEAAKAPASLIELVKEPRTADWIAVVEEQKVILVSAAEWRQARGGKPARAFGPAAIDDKLTDWLKDNLGRIARGQGLLALSSAAARIGAFGEESPNVTIEVLRYADRLPTTKPTVVREGPTGMTLRAGEYVAFRLTNRGRETVDVTLLFIDNDYGIFAIFPRPGTVSDNRLFPKQTLTTRRGKVTADTTGLEHIVAIVVKAEDAKHADFSYLEQSSIARAREVAGKTNPGPGSRLGQLFQNSLYGSDIINRGYSRASTEGAVPFALKLLSWRTLPRSTKKTVAP